MTSESPSRCNTSPTRCASHCCSSNRPVDNSVTASDTMLSLRCIAPNKLEVDSSSSDSSTSVPGVTTRVTPRFTTPIACADSSSCSQTATRKPASTILRMYPSAAWWGTPAISRPLPRCVSESPIAFETMRASSSNIS